MTGTRTNSIRYIFQDTGAIAFEIVLLLPLFLVMLLFLLWMSVTVNARTSLTSATASSVRLAITRGDINRNAASTNLVNHIREWLLTNDPSAVSGWTDIEDLLISPDLIGIASPFSSSGWYSKGWNTTLFSLGSGSFQNLPPSHILALIYAYQELSHGAGQIRFPCNPWGAPPIDAPGCARCINIHATSRNICPPGAGTIWDPITESCTGPTSSANYPSTTTPLPQFNTANYNQSFVGVHCEYRPDHGLLTPMDNLMRFIGGDGMFPTIFTRSNFIELSPVRATIS